MRLAGSGRLAWSAWGAVLLLAAALLVLATLNVPHFPPGEAYSPFWMAALMGIAYATVGALIVSRRGNPIGWIFSTVGFALVFGFFAEQYAFRGAVVSPGSLPGTALVAAVTPFVFSAVSSLGLLFLVFPSGRLRSPRWRPVAWAVLGGAAMGGVGFALRPGRLNGMWNETGVRIENPIGVPALEGLLEVLWQVGTGLAVVASLVAAVALLLRFRRTTGDERQQIKLLVYVVGAAAALFVPMLILGLFVETDSVLADALWIAFFTTLVVGIPVSVAIAILKYRLYDIDVVINRTVVFGVLAAFVTAVYVGIVVGIGTLVGSRGNLFLSILATAIIAVGFQPLRDRARHLANRLVYGKRATPYEVLSEFSERMGGAYATGDLLPRMARILGEGTGAASARVWLRVGSELRPAATWPEAEAGTEPLPVREGALPAIEGAAEAVPVRHQGELLGALSVNKRPGEPLTPTEGKLIADLAAQAGLVLRNVRLIEELRASRQRIVTAQDSRAKALERNLHDGAQQQLVALAVKLRLAETLAERDPARVAPMLVELKAEAQDALDNLRDLARGIYPPLLADRGLAAALEAQARKASVPVTVAGDGVGRFPQEVEAGVYFCCLEALQNVAKYSGAAHATVTLAVHDEELWFSVEDDGRGFDPTTTPHGAGLQNMADRIAALGGTLEVRSAPGQGTTVSGRLPVPAPGGDGPVRPGEGFRERSGSVRPEGRIQ